jgi:hypothetical protein
VNGRKGQADPYNKLHSAEKETRDEAVRACWHCWFGTIGYIIIPFIEIGSRKWKERYKYQGKLLLQICFENSHKTKLFDKQLDSVS